jgi:4-hydroxy-3-methylbut-2-en-1-yl diphosphate reductase
MDTKAFKRSLNHSENYHRKGFGHQDEVAVVLESEYQSDLIQEIRDRNYTLTRGDVTIRLAQSFGFCWITNEIIHNPSVNQRLREMNVNFIQLENGVKNFEMIDSGDVVILPAFGASIQEMQLLNDKGCTIVDTTCPWVSKVWNTIEKHKKKDYTSIIHGQYKHEETVATSSFADKYLVVLNMAEANYVAEYILNNGESSAEKLVRRNEFLTKFSQAYSVGFDPDLDLESGLPIKLPCSKLRLKRSVNYLSGQ